MTYATVPCVFCSALNRVDLGRIADRPKCGSCSRPILLDRPIRLSDSDFDRVVQDSAVKVVVDFYADWCMPCKAMAPAIDEIAHAHAGRVLVAKLDTDKNPATAVKFRIHSIPTLIVFERGVETVRRAGALRRAEIETLLGLRTDSARA